MLRNLEISELEFGLTGHGGGYLSKQEDGMYLTPLAQFLTGGGTEHGMWWAEDGLGSSGWGFPAGVGAGPGWCRWHLQLGPGGSGEQQDLFLEVCSEHPRANGNQSPIHSD